VATEIAEGGQAALDAFARMRDTSLPDGDRYVPGFTDHDPAAGQPAGPMSLVGVTMVSMTSRSMSLNDLPNCSQNQAMPPVRNIQVLGILQQLGLA